MSGKAFLDPMSDNDCFNYIRPPSKTQIVTSFLGRTSVTLVNPQRVTNNIPTDAIIALRLRGDTGFTAYSFAGNQDRILEAAEIGSAADGTTSTSVIINGID